MVMDKRANIMSKKTGLSAFTSKSTATEKVDATPAPAQQRKRGKGETVALSVRVKHSDWERIHQFAVSEGLSINSLAILGLSRLLEAKGMPSLDGAA